MSYRLQILHESSYGQSQQITQNKFCNYVITKLHNYVIIIELKVWTLLSLLFYKFKPTKNCKNIQKAKNVKRAKHNLNFDQQKFGLYNHLKKMCSSTSPTTTPTEMSSFVPSAITHSFFELQTPYFT